MYKQSQLFNGIDSQPPKIVKTPLNLQGYFQDKHGYELEDETNVLYAHHTDWEDSMYRKNSLYNPNFVTYKSLKPAYTPTNFIGIKEIRGRQVIDYSKRITCGLDNIFTSKQKLTNEQLIKHPKNPYKFSA